MKDADKTVFFVLGGLVVLAMVLVVALSVSSSSKDHLNDGVSTDASSGVTGRYTPVTPTPTPTTTAASGSRNVDDGTSLVSVSTQVEGPPLTSFKRKRDVLGGVGYFNLSKEERKTIRSTLPHWSNVKDMEAEEDALEIPVCIMHLHSCSMSLTRVTLFFFFFFFCHHVLHFIACICVVPSL